MPGHAAALASHPPDQLRCQCRLLLTPSAASLPMVDRPLKPPVTYSDSHTNEPANQPTHTRAAAFIKRSAIDKRGWPLRWVPLGSWIVSRATHGGGGQAVKVGQLVEL